MLHLIKHKRRGYTITDTVVLSREQAKALRDIYDKQEIGRNWVISMYGIVLGTVMLPVAAMIFGVALTTLQSILGEYIDDLDNVFDVFDTGKPDYNKVEFTFKYKQYNSNDVHITYMMWKYYNNSER